MAIDESEADAARRARALERRATWTSRVARSSQEAELFARIRGDALAPHERAEAIWAFTCELWASRGADAVEFRLDRSFARVERRKR